MKTLPLTVFKRAARGNRNAAEVLKELWHWVVLVRESEGRDWYAMSRAKIMKETGLSLDQVKRALVYLRSRGLITSAQHLFGGKNINHYTVTQSGQDAIRKAALGAPDAPPECCTPAPLEQCNSAPPEWCSSQPLITTPSSTPSSAPSTCVLIGPQENFSPAKKEAGKEEQKEKVEKVEDAGKPEEEEKIEKEKNMNMSEALKAGMSKKIMHKPDSTASTGFLWKHLISGQENTLVVLKAKELGQLGQFVKLCPPAQAEAVLTSVVGSWIAFTKRVEQDVGIKSSPAKPHIGFLLQYASTAVMFHESLKLTSNPAPKSQEATFPLAALPTPPVKVTATHEKPASQEEMLAILKG